MTPPDTTTPPAPAPAAGPKVNRLGLPIDARSVTEQIAAREKAASHASSPAKGGAR